jgi:alkylation response protein AidB-like acyl-CoA dehydrogenase
MTAVPATVPDISPDFVAGLAERAQEAEGLRRLPRATVDDFVASGLADLLVPARYGGIQAPWPAILDPVRRVRALTTRNGRSANRNGVRKGPPWPTIFVTESPT